jgi:protein-ribulosamine 3-kinase
MTLPPTVQAAVESALARRSGRESPIAEVAAVGGGCISPTGRITTAAGDRFFIKWSGPELPSGLIAAEALGLRQLAEARAVRVPNVVAVSEPGGEEWLLLEWLQPGGAEKGTWERLGQELAALHRNQASGFGADQDNFIGPLHQGNSALGGWPEFWRDRRLRPQLRMALDRGLLADTDATRFHRLLDRLDDLIAPGNEEGPSLLHGDLWSGNVHITGGSVAALVDPSVYYGHREVDLAMADLFGGFDSRFHAAYREAWPIQAGYEDGRRAVYQLYYLLVHVNLFGAGYVERTRQTLSRTGV